MSDKDKKIAIITSITALALILLAAYGLYWAFSLRFHETTDDAYVNGNIVQVTSQQRGIVTTIYGDNTQLVEEGQSLFELDPRDCQIDLEKAMADLADAVRSVQQMFIKVKELSAKKDSSLAELFKANQDFHHRQLLVADGAISGEEFEHSQVALFTAYADMRQVAQELDSAKAQTENTTLETHPKVEQAKSALRKAYLALHRCTVLAPAKGIITQRKAQVGQWVEGNDTLLSIVPLDQIWVDANYRETDLKHVRLGQEVKLTADMYGKSVHFHGKVIGFNPGSGSVFSLIPAQNASGNWIKIIQRFPVKISLEKEEIEKYPLFLGASMITTIDTHNRSGSILPKVTPPQAFYQTDIYDHELDGVDDLIQGIIANNKCCNDQR